MKSTRRHYVYSRPNITKDFYEQNLFILLCKHGAYLLGIQQALKFKLTLAIKNPKEKEWRCVAWLPSKLRATIKGQTLDITSGTQYELRQALLGGGSAARVDRVIRFWVKVQEIA